MKPVDVKDNAYIDFKKEVNDKDPKFKVDNHVRISKYTNIFAKGYTPNWSEEVFVIKKVKNTVPWTYVINDLNGEKIIGTLYEKELQKVNLKEFRIKKVIKRKVINYISNGKVIIIHLIAELIKKIQCDSIDCNCMKICQCFPKPCELFGGDISVKVGLLNYATKTDITHVDTSSFALKIQLV